MPFFWVPEYRPGDGPSGGILVKKSRYAIEMLNDPDCYGMVVNWTFFTDDNRRVISWPVIKWEGAISSTIVHPARYEPVSVALPRVGMYEHENCLRNRFTDRKRQRLLAVKLESLANNMDNVVGDIEMIFSVKDKNAAQLRSTAEKVREWRWGLSRVY